MAFFKELLKCGYRSKIILKRIYSIYKHNNTYIKNNNTNTNRKNNNTNLYSVEIKQSSIQHIVIRNAFTMKLKQVDTTHYVL